ncbi:hypothetical protein [Niastella sp. OAS944]|uniref:hypothetical protein n=1 Tax=Niastella sp. OAS944 TaxID=2664089 RepID=UPI00347B8796|nr:hypothetical protein [Chitinophagaceae bacterium OAS944]
MKKVRIFLAIALVGVAAAAAAFTKVKVTENIYYYNPGTHQIEFYQNTDRPCPELGTGCLIDVPGVGTGLQAYIFDTQYKSLKN